MLMDRLEVMGASHCSTILVSEAQMSLFARRAVFLFGLAKVLHVAKVLHILDDGGKWMNDGHSKHSTTHEMLLPAISCWQRISASS